MDDLRQFLLRPWYELLLIGIAPAGIIPLLQYWAISPYGHPFLAFLTDFTTIFGLLILAACIFSPWALLAPHEFRMRLFCAGLLAATIGGWIAGDRVRKSGFIDLAERSKPLIAAISAYEKDQGEPPASLEDLVPDYLPQVPWTGMGAHPEYQYFTGADAKSYDDNPWVLVVQTPQGMNFDAFLFFPRQNYPKLGHGGWLERIGDWAYLHE